MKIYDNSNLVESYAGTATPLTFSFAKRIYSGVYRYFASTLGVNKKVIKENDEMFNNMVASIGYHMYYDLNNWYKLISFLPGYKQNKKFFEKMLGVQKQHVEQKKERKTIKTYFTLLPFLIFRLSKIIFHFLFMRISVRKFNKYFDKVYKRTTTVDLRALNTVELKKLFLSLDNQLISRWSIPIINDFAVMVYAGIVDVLAQKWLPGSNVYNLLFLQNHEKLSSLDPSRQLYQIAQDIKKDDGMSSLFLQSDEYIIEDLFNNYPDHHITILIKEYLTKFGFRSPNELKLETKTIGETPTTLIAILKTIIRNSSEDSFVFKKENTPQSGSSSKLSWWKKLILKVALSMAGKALKDREETRFRRSIIFGYIRKIFLEIGEKFVAQGKLKEKNDIFFMSIEEIFSVIDGSIKTVKLEKIELIKKEFIFWSGINCPRRIENDNGISVIERLILEKKIVSQPKEYTNSTLSGIVSSSPYGLNSIEGEALVMKNFEPQGDFKNKILITKQTDPGWTIIFPFLKGVIVEKGGMLSHASIVARELNIPCVVGVEGATDLINNKEHININLTNGEIKHY